MVKLFHDGGSYHIEISQLICREKQWAGLIGTYVMKELEVSLVSSLTQLMLHFYYP